jgi:preprotein translocase subunit SecF
MESQGGGKRSEDQLQGTSIQDQAVRSVASGPRVTQGRVDQGTAAERNGSEAATESTSPSTYKVVIRFEDHAVRGFAQASEIGTVEQLLRNDPQHSLESVRVTLPESGEVKQVEVADAKAIFFVKTFDGDLRHRALHFHEHAPVMQGLWIRVRFQDGEAIEGIISNTHDHVLGQGFFMMPTDPNGNNKLIYVLKSRLKDFNVLGIRNAPRTPTF